MTTLVKTIEINYLLLKTGTTSAQSWYIATKDMPTVCLRYFQVGIYLFKTTMWSLLANMTPERRHSLWRLYCNFARTYQIACVFQLLTLNRWIPVGLRLVTEGLQVFRTKHPSLKGPGISTTEWTKIRKSQLVMLTLRGLYSFSIRVLIIKIFDLLTFLKLWLYVGQFPKLFCHFSTLRCFLSNF